MTLIIMKFIYHLQNSICI